jgi:hypothetical protein
MQRNILPWLIFLSLGKIVNGFLPQHAPSPTIGRVKTAESTHRKFTLQIPSRRFFSLICSFARRLAQRISGDSEADFDLSCRVVEE